MQKWSQFQAWIIVLLIIVKSYDYMIILNAASKKKEYVLEIIKSQPYVDGSQESKVVPFERGRDGITTLSCQSERRQPIIATSELVYKKEWGLRLAVTPHEQQF